MMLFLRISTLVSSLLIMLSIGSVLCYFQNWCTEYQRFMSGARRFSRSKD